MTLWMHSVTSWMYNGWLWCNFVFFSCCLFSFLPLTWCFPCSMTHAGYWHWERTLYICFNNEWLVLCWVSIIRIYLCVLVYCKSLCWWYRPLCGRFPLSRITMEIYSSEDSMNLFGLFLYPCASFETKLSLLPKKIVWGVTTKNASFKESNPQGSTGWQVHLCMQQVWVCG